MRTLIVDTDRVQKGTSLTVTLKLDKERMGKKNLLKITIANNSKWWHFHPSFGYIVGIVSDEPS